DAFDKKPRVQLDDRIYNASPQKLLAVITEPRKARSLVMVGHNPSLHEFALQLIDSGDVQVREQLHDIRTGRDGTSDRRMAAGAAACGKTGAVCHAPRDRRCKRIARRARMRKPLGGRKKPQPEPVRSVLAREG